MAPTSSAGPGSTPAELPTEFAFLFVVLLPLQSSMSAKRCPHASYVSPNRLPCPGGLRPRPQTRGAVTNGITRASHRLSS
jgi:hypothetical protein